MAASKSRERERTLVGFYKRASGRGGITWPESVDEALSFGWIDAVRKSIDGESYAIRFTHRKPTSIWSDINIAKARRLIAEGRMSSAGLAAWALRAEERSGVYAFERKTATLSPEFLSLFKRDRRAWAFFQAQPAHYQRIAAHSVSSAKRESTQARRLAALIAHSARRERLPQFSERKRSDSSSAL